MKITIELTNLDEVKAVVAALENRNTQTVMALAPQPPFEESQAAASLRSVTAPPMVNVKTESKPKNVKPKKAAAVETPVEPEYVNENADTGVEITEAPVTVEQVAGDIDDAKMREIGGKLLRDMNANGKDGVGELTKILSSLGSKKVTEVPMNLRPRFVAKVTEALA